MEVRMDEEDHGRPTPKLSMGIDPASIPNDVRVIVRAHRQGNGQFISLVRLPAKRWIGGVCAGIAYKLGCRPAAVRLAFILLTLTFFIGPAIYLPLWLFVPICRKLPKDFSVRIGIEPEQNLDDDST
jgi:phage shock protein PspC (stress-responsive transcriptional regulator)